MSKRKKWLSNYGAWKELQRGKSVDAYEGYDCITETPTKTFHPGFLVETTPKMFEEFLSYVSFTVAKEDE